MSFWVILDRPVLYRGRERSAFSVDSTSDSIARELVRSMLPFDVPYEIVSIQQLPYPGEPRLNYKEGACPSFCLHPAKCAGRTSCPRSIACSE